MMRSQPLLDLCQIPLKSLTEDCQQLTLSTAFHKICERNAMEFDDSSVGGY
jgi:hypothetical protein